MFWHSSWFLGNWLPNLQSRVFQIVLIAVTLPGEGMESSRVSGSRDCLMICFSFVLQAGTSSCISLVWPSAVWVSRKLILELGNLSQSLGPWLKNRALLNQEIKSGGRGEVCFFLHLNLTIVLEYIVLYISEDWMNMAALCGKDHLRITKGN